MGVKIGVPNTTTITSSWIKLVSFSFLVVSVATIATLINEEYYYDHPDDVDDPFLVKPIDKINMLQSLSPHHSSVMNKVESTILPNNKQQDNNNNDNLVGSSVLATIQGQEAVKISEGLNQGNLIKFNIKYNDGDDNPVIIELVST